VKRKQSGVDSQYRKHREMVTIRWKHLVYPIHPVTQVKALVWYTLAD